MREGSMKFPVAPQSMRAVVAMVLAPYCSRMGNWIARSDLFVLQSFFLIVPSYFSLILIVYLLGEVDTITPILLFFSFTPYPPFASLTFLWT